MADGESGAKQKESSQAIKMLSDNDFHDLLEETINIKTVSLQGKSPMLQRLLSEVKVDDDDFKSNFKEMAVAAGSRGTVVKKPRTERKRCKEEQQHHQRGSAAARSTQGGSLQNLSRKQDGDGRPRDKLKKSGSVNSFMAAESRLEPAGANSGLFHSGKQKSRSRSQVTKSAASDASKPSRPTRNAASAAGPVATTDASSLDRKNSKGGADRSKKCNYGSMSCDDCVSDPGYLSSCELERKCSPVRMRERSRCCSESNCSDSDGLLPKSMTGEEVEEMEVDQYENSGDEEFMEESLPLLKSTTDNPTKIANKVGSKKMSPNLDSLPSQINSQRQQEEVDRGIAIPIRNKCSDKGITHFNAERRENFSYSHTTQFSERYQSIHSSSTKQDENHSKAKGDCLPDGEQQLWLGSNGIYFGDSQLRKKKNVKSELIISNNFGQGDGKLDENGNPVDELKNGSSLRKYDSTDIERSTADGEKRRKHKRAKATLKEMKAGDISGNRGNEPVDSLLEFINSTDKKGKPMPAKCNIVDTTNKKSTMHKNNIKVPNGKTKKQEKENNKRNLPDVRLSVDLSNEVIVPCSMDKDSIYDLLDDNEHCSESISRESSEMSDTKLVINGSKRLPNQKLLLDDENDLQDYLPSKNAVYIKNNVIVQKARSWESETVPIPSLGEYDFTTGDDEHELHMSCDMIKMHPSRMVIGTAHSESYDTAGEVSSFVADFYAVADVPQVVEDSEFHVVTKRQRRSKMRSDGYVLRNSKRGSTYGGCGFSDDRDFAHLPWSRPEDMVLLAGMSLTHRGQRSGSESRRKSTSSMPPSDHSSVDNSDLDSVHSLPVKSTTVKPTIAKTSSSSSNTPQASYADIAKMAASSLPQRNRVHSAPLSKTPSSEVSLAFPLVDMTSNEDVARSHISHPSLFSSISSIHSENKRDASTSTTDDIPTVRSSSPSLFGAPITHWASYPTLAEATGKNGAKSGGGVSVQSDGDRSSGTGRSGDSGSASYSRKSPSGTCSEGSQRNCDPATNGAGLLGRGQRRRSTDGGPPISVHPFVSEPKCPSASVRDKDKASKEGKGNAGDNPSVSDDRLQQCSEVVVPSKPVTPEPPRNNSSVVTIGASSSSVTEALPSVALSLKAATSDPKAKVKNVRKGSSKSLPAVVIMNNYEPLPCFSEFTFGFEINEQLVLMSNPTSVAEGSLSLSSPSSSPSPDSAATTTEAVISPTDAACGSPALAASSSTDGSLPAVETRCNSLMPTSVESGSPNSRSNSPDLSAKSNEDEAAVASAPPQPEEMSSFNYENVISYITHTWDDVVKEYETEVKLSSECRLTKIQYHGSND